MLAINTHSLRLDVAIRVEKDFDFLGAEYKSFFNLKRGTAFQSPLWMDLVHRRLTPNLSARQYTITIRQPEDGALLAVFPFVIQRASGLDVVQPADFGVCDYNAVVGDRFALEAFAADPSVRERLDQLLQGGSVLLFRKIRNDGFDPADLFARPQVSPCENSAFWSDIGTDFEAWQRRTVRRKFSKELGRLARQLERDRGTYEHRAASSEQEVREAFELLKRAREGRFESDLLHRELYWDFYLEFAIAGQKSGDCITYVSYLNGQPVAVLFGLTGEEQFHAVLIGFDAARFARYSIGLQIIYRVIKLRFEQGFRRIDMGLGNSGYKSHFRVEETKLHNLTCSRSLAGSAFSLIYHRSKPLKNALKRFVPKLR
ncbi:GNAT family N-acetyltransferase [Bradyrhizobium sp. LHD-71]|uniref:GNAT family N-acetyltransferase n=1 Tax=Bradyrhizobium sp. LHD-71 TaxID=3072141 RepID=UPI00280D33D5|nr:GNAT family N-acetyltransferase [Bradyrhizobium sp. LHD-71]MDQ8726662.1 GNAT family N-acetyltransferase [Bradyrhizobium sp. LHD-71]